MADFAISGDFQVAIRRYALAYSLKSAGCARLIWNGCFIPVCGFYGDIVCGAQSYPRTGFSIPSIAFTALFMLSDAQTERSALAIEHTFDLPLLRNCAISSSDSWL